MQLFDDFFRNYGTPFATAVAVLNTVITVTVSQYLKDSPRARAILVGASIVFGSIAVGATFYSQYQTMIAAKAETARRAMIREGTGKFIAAGDSLMDELTKNQYPLPVAEEKDWAKTVEGFIRVNLSESYVVRFNDIIGITFPKLADVDFKHFVDWGNVYMRVVRLQEFSRELPL
jgi:hypothetical protein